MIAIVSACILPVIPFLAWKIRHKETSCKGMEIFARYLGYLLFMVFLLSMALGVMASDDAPFWRKINDSFEFALKFFLLSLGSVLLEAGMEWLYEWLGATGRKAALNKRWDKAVNGKAVIFLQKYIFSGILFLLAAVVVWLNVRLMFDNVLWGDEAFSANTAQKSVGGILQVLYFWDNHPPLYYYWLKLVGQLFGYTVPVFHLASLIPFMIGVLLAITLFRRHLGKIPAVIMVVMSGLGAACLEYNLEVRMYSLAFLCVLAAFYCSYRVICTGKRSAWTGLVLWALAAAYSHYYALVAVGFLLFFTGVAVWMKERGRSWRKGLLAIVFFFVGYSPWLLFLLVAIKNVNNNWWMTEILGLDKALDIVMGSRGMSKIVFPMLLILLAVFLLAEAKKWSDATYAMVVGAATITATLSFAYLLCVIIAPLLAQRYMYPLSAVAVSMLAVGCSHSLALLEGAGKKIQLHFLGAIGKMIWAVIILLFIIIGIGNYRDFSMSVTEQKVKTDETLELIGRPDSDVEMVTNGVKHLGWTVLYFYYPDNEIVNGNYNQTEADRYWYFTPTEMGKDEITLLNEKGYRVKQYGERQISQYPFILYYMEKTGENNNYRAY